MTYEFFHENDFVFHEGDEGKKFYIILDGLVDVLVTREKTD